jgi:DNA topoisomerase-3
LQTKIKKSGKVFNNNKVTDHHAIIPTGAAVNLYGPEGNVYDIITKRFLAAFYPDCQVSNTTVEAEVATHQFRVKGKQILEPGWRVVYEKDEVKKEPNPEQGEEELAILPAFTKGEKGPHEPWLDKKMTSPPKDFTEATLLRAMETAGKQVEDEDLKEALKENGIGRPSTRAAIIETLYKRQYVKKDKKKIVPTQIGIDLIGVIQNPTLTSVELTGQWERKLRQIESGVVKSEDFLAELQNLVREMVREVKTDGRVLKIETPAETSPGKPASKNGIEKAPKAAKAPKTEKVKSEKTEIGGEIGKCPACEEGKILKGKQAYGCVRWKEGCKFRLPMEWHGKPLADKQVAQLLKGKKVAVKNLLAANNEKFDAAIFLDERFELQFEKTVAGPPADPFEKCPSCQQGKVLKGNSAFGCSRFRDNCKLRIPFELAGRKLTDKQIAELLLKGKTPKIKGFTSPKTGEKFDAALVLQPEGTVTFQF